MTGVDINPDRIKLLWKKYNINVIKVDSEQELLPFKIDSYDIILFFEIIEHLRINPLYALREAYRTLKQGGQIIVSTPNITPIDRIDFLLGRNFQEEPVEAFKKLETLDYMGYLRLYTTNEVQNFLESVGFEVTSYTYKGNYIRTGWKAKIIMKLPIYKKEQFRPHLYMFAKKPSSLQ